MIELPGDKLEDGAGPCRGPVNKVESRLRDYDQYPADITRDH